MEYLFEYGMFLAKTLTIVLAFMAIVTIMVAAGQRRRHMPRGNISVTHLNRELDSLKDSLQRVVLDKFAFKKYLKAEKKREKAEAKQLKLSAEQSGVQGADGAVEEDDSRRRRVFVLDFDGDMEASGLESLRQEITAVLTMAEPKDEVMLRLESPGGLVHAYGLASSQLLRFKQKEIPLTICVDKVAASGGYMMACVADRLIAAPFAILGSIGVLVQMPNIHRLLKKNDVDFELITAGEYKRTMTPFTEVTEKGRDKLKQDVEEMHVLFKQWVKQYRPIVDIDQIATGETWVGLQAQERQMVDMISTSDDYIIQACEQADVYEVAYEIRIPLGEKIGGALQKAMDKTLMVWWQRLRSSRYL
ncbi:MAG: protease SohB [Pseudohongiella sp.]|nr:protease SohB [Pseudohongiella sp.]